MAYITHIIAHRGLDRAKKNYPFESSKEAFLDQLSRGYGLEFDLQITADDEIIVFHDSDLKRISCESNGRLIKNVTKKELLELDLNGCHLMTFYEILSAIQEKSAPSSLSAIHLKSKFQTEKRNLYTLLRELERIDSEKFIIFDITIETAQFLKNKNSSLHLAPSVSHPYDIKRYNRVVGGTLLTIQEALSRKDLFDWVWLDEWDLLDENKKKKKLYTKEVFDTFQKLGIKVALVTPELHTTSPGLLGGEAHPDAQNQKILIARFAEILSLKPDALCTDYPDEIASIINL